MALRESGVEPFLMGEVLVENNETYSARLEGEESSKTLHSL